MMVQAKILVIEDEQPIAEILQFTLQKAGYDVALAFDGDDGLEFAVSYKPDLILLDVMLPKRDGFEVCQSLRRFFSGPIIMLTARDTEMDKVAGLDTGADDYITKPYSSRELVARVKAHLRRFATEPTDRKNEWMVGSLVINEETHSVFKEGQPVSLTHREFELLVYLVKRRGVVLTRDHLLQEVWGYDYYGDARTVDVTIRRLREKIEVDPANPEYIVTFRGVGYALRK